MNPRLVKFTVELQNSSRNKQALNTYLKNLCPEKLLSIFRTPAKAAVTVEKS